jgi:exopolysaccharide biosynthesis polyprenyl glycosylphosphotransferase
VNLFTDLAFLGIATVAAAGHPSRLHPADWASLFWVSMTVTSIWVVTAAALRHYSAHSYDRAAPDDMALIGVQAAALITVLTLIEFLAPAGTLTPRTSHFLLMASIPIALSRRLFCLLAHREPPLDDVLIVGIGPIARLTAQDLRMRGRHRVVGHLRFSAENGRETSLLERCYAVDHETCAILGDFADLERALRSTAVDEVYVAGNARKHNEEMQAAIGICESFGVPFAIPAYAFRLERAQAVDAAAVADGYLHYETHRPRLQQQAMKRLFDIVASALALWVLLPVFLMVMAVIKLTSRGPIFFKQARVGLHGRAFNMLKFRSMVVGAEALKRSLAALNEQSGPVFKMHNDPRVTRFGRFIRKYSIDELPQLINVLRGDMSVVGPRPPVPEELEKYEAWQRRRLSVRPGLTCIWQVSGRNQISFEDWMVLDMQYIDHWSLGRDFNLIFRTIPVVLTGRGAS